MPGQRCSGRATRRELASSDRLFDRRIQQSNQRGECAAVTRVRRGRNQNQVPLRIGGELTEQLVALLMAGRRVAGGRGVRLVDDNELGTALKEARPPPVALDEVDRHNRYGILVEDRLVQRQVALEPSDRAGPDFDRGKVKFLD